MFDYLTGFNMSLVIQLASQDQNVDPLIRDHSVEVLTRHIDDALKYQRDYGTRNKSVCLSSILQHPVYVYLTNFLSAKCAHSNCCFEMLIFRMLIQIAQSFS